MSLRRSIFALIVACGAPARVVDLPAPAPATCSVTNLDLEPLVVDLRADKRADLETALSRGVVAVAYDCDGVRVLSDCHAKGEYAFVGVTEKEQLVRLTSEVEVRANLPTSSTAFERARKGRELDLALAIVGLRSIPTSVLTKDAFTGQCDGMTHFVRKVTVGAFGIGYASPTADVLFSSGEMHDGSLTACRAVQPMTDTLPHACSAPLRITLAPIGAALASETTRHCAAGTVLTDGGECRAPNNIAFHLCEPADLTDCTTQCEKGSMGSCAIAGHTYQVGRGVPADLARAKQFLTRACDGGSAQGCHRLGEIRQQEHAPEALSLFEKSCRAGWLDGCDAMAAIALTNAASKLDVAALLKRSCAGGDVEGCSALGKLYETGIGVTQNDTEAVRLYEIACASGTTRRACVSLSVMVERGRGTAADPARAVSLLERACEKQGSSDSCGMLSLHYFEGRGVTRDNDKGVAYLVRACEGDDRGSCLPLAMRYQAGIGVPKDPERAKKYFTRACDTGLTMACEQLHH